MVSFIMDNPELSAFEFWASDLSLDSIINVLDIIATINLIFE